MKKYVNEFIGVLVIAAVIGSGYSLILAFGKLSDLKGHVKTEISYQDGRVVLGHRIGPDGNLQLVYKN